MNRILNIILDWSEVWALLIPLAIILLYRQRIIGMRQLVLYVLIALVLNSFSTIFYFFHEQMSGFMRNNNIFYNLHSIARTILFGWFIYEVTPNRNSLVFRVLMIAYGIFAVINFIFINSILFFSPWLFAAESIILLLFCIRFYLNMMQDESRVNWTKQPFFLVCLGISLYEVVTFFIFLFIIPMAEKNPEFGLLCLKIYKITYVILCILLAIGLYKNARKQGELGREQRAT